VTVELVFTSSELISC